MMKPIWRDETVRGEVRSSEIKLTEDLALVVHRHIDYPPDVWLWSTRGEAVISMQKLPGGLSLFEAKGRALGRLWHKLDLMSDAIENAQVALTESP